MTYSIRPSSKFQKDLKRARKRGYNLDLLTRVIKALADGKELSPKHKDHCLTGNFAGFRECHITPDWLLIYEIDHNSAILYLVRSGTHSDLF